MSKDKKSILGILITNLLVVIGIDFLFGLYFPTKKYLDKNKFSWNQYSSNYREYFDELKINNQTVYGFEENNINYDLIKEPHQNYNGIKILSIGDSFTEGQGVRPTDNYSAWISRISSDRYRAKNTGQGGANTDQILNIYKNLKLDFNPNYVVYGLCLNDINFEHSQFKIDIDGKGFEEGKYKNDFPLKWDLINLRTGVIENTRNKLVNFFYKNSNIISYAISEFELNKISKQTIEFYKKSFDLQFNKVEIEKFENQMNWLNEDVSKKNGKLVIMIFPIFYWPGGDYPLIDVHEKLSKMLNKKGIQYIDLLPDYIEHEDRNLWVHPVDQHPNDFAHKIAAEKLIKFFDQNRNNK